VALVGEWSRHTQSQMEAGIDSVIQKRKPVGVPSFHEVAAVGCDEPRKTKHNCKWLQLLEACAFPTIGERAGSDIDGLAVGELLVSIACAHTMLTRIWDPAHISNPMVCETVGDQNYLHSQSTLEGEG
jgi:hypothetical protein